MLKTLSLLLLALCIASLSALEIMVESYDTSTEIWLLLPYDLFLFGSGESEYQLSTQIKDAKGKQVAVREEQILIPRKQWLDRTAIPMLQQYQLKPGSYQLNLSLRNKKMGDRRNYSKTFRIGTRRTEIGQPYVIAQRENIRFIPEVINVAEYDSLTLRQSFSVPIRQISVSLDSLTYDFPYPQSPCVLDLKPLATTDSIGSLKLSLFEGNIRYDMDALVYQPWFSFNALFSPKDQLAQIRYIADQNEWQVLRKVPEDKIPEAIESYWQAKDPSPGTIRNEYRERFYSRVLKAEEQFTIHKRLRGWKSDRGRIYIKFGEPEQIVINAFPMGEAPSIRWYYYRLNRTFIFTDERGYGQYTLRNKDEEYLDH
ncbi:MAG TPA: GWxTD domain-containing protein [Candidatus Cloacimonadota bacterium]|jgi:GWxTD domain-containing protein|nr:GWxTD domain-containing protein [Candidatus Cloacimonadota bacterium]